MNEVSVMTMDSSQNQNAADNHVEEQGLLDTALLSKQKTGNQKKIHKSGALEDDFDDNASVSSSMSSASEHSVKNDAKVKKVKKQRCLVHSKSSQAKLKDVSDNKGTTNECSKQLESIVDNDDATENTESTERKQSKCTCRNNSRNKMLNKNIVTRPEPEGSLLSDPSKACFLDDFERVIYSSEPLFSDLEDDPMLEEKIRAESERFHRRVTDPENIFSAVQMLSTSTMMKLAIIQTELKNVKDVSLRRSEGEIVSAAKRAELLRESFEHTENSFKSVSSQIHEAVEAIGPLDKNPPAAVVQGGRAAAVEKKQNILEKEQQKLATDVTSKKRSFGGKHLVNEVDLEMAQCNLEVAEMTISEIEEEQMVISNAKKSRNTSEFEEIIRRLSQRLGQAEKQAREAEQVILYLGQHLKDMQEVCLEKKKKHRPISSEINASFAELSVFLS